MFKKYFCILFTMILSLSFLMGCGPSEEKIAQAQTKYTELVTAHNQVVEAHKEIEDGSLDTELVSLFKELAQMDQFHLNEMEEEEIESLIRSMDDILISYQEYLTAIAQIKSNEEAAVITTIPVSLINDTGLTIHQLFFQEKGDTSPAQNVLVENTDLVNGQCLTGLFIYRDADNTPWIFTLEDAEGNNYCLELPVADYTEEGCDLTLTYDAETQEIKIG